MRFTVRRLLIALSLGLSLAGSAIAAPYTATVPIIQGDVAQAREAALREVLYEAGLNGEVDLRTTTAVQDDRVAQSALITSRFRLKSFAIVDEQIIGKQLRLTVDIEKDPALAQPELCTPVFWARNVAIRWRIAPGVVADGSLKTDARFFWDGLLDELRQHYPGILNSHEAAGEAAYRIEASLAPASSKIPLLPLHQFRIDLLGADGRLLHRFDYPLGLRRLTTQQRESLGYANLVQRTLAPEAASLQSQIARDVGQALRCLPVVVRIPPETGNPEIAITGVAGQLGSGTSLGLFGESFPVRAGGDVDLLALRGQLKPNSQNGHQLSFKRPKKIAGRPYPSPGNYLLLQ